MRGLLARVIRAIGNSLLRTAEQLSADLVQSAAVDPLGELRLRFPSAPEHWLKIIAARAPHLATTGSVSAAATPRVRQRARTDADDDHAASPIVAGRSQSHFTAPAKSDREPIGEVPPAERPVGGEHHGATAAQRLRIPATKPRATPTFIDRQIAPRAEPGVRMNMQSRTISAAEPAQADLSDRPAVARAASNAATSDALPLKPKSRPMFLLPQTLPVAPVAPSPSRPHRPRIAFVSPESTIVRQPAIAPPSDRLVATPGDPALRATSPDYTAAAKATADRQLFAPAREQRQRRLADAIETMRSERVWPADDKGDRANVPGRRAVKQIEPSGNDAAVRSQREFLERTDDAQEFWAELPPTATEPDPAHRAMIVAEERRRIDALCRDQVERIWNA